MAAPSFTLRKLETYIEDLRKTARAFYGTGSYRRLNTPMFCLGKLYDLNPKICFFFENVFEPEVYLEEVYGLCLVVKNLLFAITLQDWTMLKHKAPSVLEPRIDASLLREVEQDAFKACDLLIWGPEDTDIRKLPVYQPIRLRRSPSPDSDTSVDVSVDTSVTSADSREIKDAPEEVDELKESVATSAEQTATIANVSGDASFTRVDCFDIVDAFGKIDKSNESAATSTKQTATSAGSTEIVDAFSAVEKSKESTVTSTEEGTATTLIANMTTLTIGEGQSEF